MHSSRMRTIHSSDRISGGSAQGGVCSGGCLLWGVSALGGVCSRGYVSAPGGCVCSGECVSALGGVCSQGVCLLPGGCLLLGGCVYSWRGCLLWVCVCVCVCVVSQHALPCGQTDACKNIAFATSLRTVTNRSKL